MDVYRFSVSVLKFPFPIFQNKIYKKKNLNEI
jgi:hypothetical protein